MKNASIPSAVGAELRAARMAQNILLADAATQLRIKEAHLLALENGHFDDLPGAAYVSGFLRSYAQFLGLDAHAVQARFKQEMAALLPAPQLSMPTPIAESKLPNKAILFGSAALALLLLIVGSVWLFQEPTAEPAASASITAPAAPTTATAPVVSAVEQAASEPAIPVAAPAVSADEPAAIPSQLAKKEIIPITLHADGDAYVQVRDGQNRVILNRLLRPGQSLELPQGEGYRLTLGNAGGVRLSVGDKDFGIMGEAAEVRRNLPLTPAGLRRQAAPARAPAADVDAAPAQSSGQESGGQE